VASGAYQTLHLSIITFFCGWCPICHVGDHLSK
jgi:hypothetical protein